jgi:hypothetical protein
LNHLGNPEEYVSDASHPLITHSIAVGLQSDIHIGTLIDTLIDTLIGTLIGTLMDIYRYISLREPPPIVWVNSVRS